MNIEDVEHLKVLQKMVQPSKTPLYKLTPLQNLLLSQSLKEANAGEFISQDEVEAQQLEWLKEK